MPTVRAKITSRKFPLMAVSITAVALWTAIASAAPTPELWSYWTLNDPDSDKRVEHSSWSRFLQTYLVDGPDGVTRVRYGRVSADDRGALEAYIRQLAQTIVTRLNRAEQMAYWLNLYNALTVKVILDHYPVDSIRDIDISPGLFADGPWGKKLVRVEGKSVSLDDIEHRILRPIWKDPRIHYGVNCASIGCPNLQTVAFEAGNVDRLLSQGAREYVNSSRGARVENGKLTVSSIYIWFQSDFGGTEAGVIDHLKQFAEAGLRKSLDGLSRISDDDYDWSINAAKGE